MTQILKNKSKILSNKQGTRVRIPWQIDDNIPKWTNVCEWAIEQFGLPGDKYTTHPTEHYMDFYFKDEKDAVHFELRWG